MKIEMPHLPDELQEEKDIATKLLEASEQDGKIVEKEVKNQHVSNVELTMLSFECVKFYGCTFENCKLEKGHFKDVLFEKCDLSNCNISFSYFLRTKMKDCRLIGSNFSYSTLKDVIFINNNMQYVAFEKSELTKVGYTRCDLSHGDLSACRCKDLAFEESILKHSLFFGSSLRGADLSTCEIDGMGINIKAEELKGSTLDFVQAITLVKSLGIDVLLGE